MKRIFSVLLLFMFSLTFLLGCGKGESLDFDLSEQYSLMIAKYEKNNSNYMFGNQPHNYKTLSISYSNAEISDLVNGSVSSNEKIIRFSALRVIEQNLLNYIFKYYETWNESFYENAYGSITKAEKESLHSSFLKLKNQIDTFKNKVSAFESEFDGVFQVSDPLAISLTLFTYQYNMVIEKSLDFMGQFIDLHTKYVFAEDTTSINAAQRLLDEYYYFVAKLTYYENVMPFNYGSGNNGTCDLSHVMKTYINSSSNIYLLIDLTDDTISNLGTQINDTLTNPEFADDARLKMKSFHFYRNQYVQNAKIYFEVYADLDFSNLAKYRFGVVANTTLEEYLSRYSIEQKASYTFAYNMLNYILPEFVDVYLELVKNN